MHHFPSEVLPPEENMGFRGRSNIKGGNKRWKAMSKDLTDGTLLGHRTKSLVFHENMLIKFLSYKGLQKHQENSGETFF